MIGLISPARYCHLRVVSGLDKSHTEAVSPSLLHIFGRPLRNVLKRTPSHFGPPPSSYVAAPQTLECLPLDVGPGFISPSVVVFLRPGRPSESSYNVGVGTPSILFTGPHAAQCLPDTGGPA